MGTQRLHRTETVLYNGGIPEGHQETYKDSNHLPSNQCNSSGLHGILRIHTCMKEVKRSHSGFGNRHYSESKHDTETRLNKTSHPHHFNKTQGYVIGILCLLILSIGLGAWALS